ncbi:MULTISPECIES: transcriptional regulator [Enterobacter]|uniref:transcriptional regulator n=1 Tax=Enterobacter TaxID=547 RepID=UPI00356761B1
MNRKLPATLFTSGSAAKLAALLSTSNMNVSHWRNRNKGRVPQNGVLSIYYATGVTPHELRPDLYPNPTDGLPKQEP